MSTEPHGITAADILTALAKQHAVDLWLMEVKTGSTFMSKRGELLRLDGLAIKRSWARPLFTGYEVKVSRSDWLRDDKWPYYMQFCHKLFVACPAGLVAPEELPEGVGLVWYEHGKLSTRRQAPFRVITPSWDMLYYILISRTEPDPPLRLKSRAELARRWLANKGTWHALGRELGTELARRVDQLQAKCDELEMQNAKLKNQVERLNALETILHENGVFWWQPDGAEKLRERLAGDGQGVDLDTVRRLVGRLAREVGAS